MATTANFTSSISDMNPLSPWSASHSPDGFFRSPVDVGGKEFYHHNGYLVLDRALSDAEIEMINAETLRICRNQEGKVGGIPPAPADASDTDVLRDILCIHFPHKVSEIMLNALAHPVVVQALTTLVGPDVKCMQSMLFIKAAGKAGQAWHQDEDYIPTRDRSLIGAWIALDDATVENGCLWIIPGSQEPGILWKQEWHGDKRFDCSLEAGGFPYTEADEVPVEVKKGSVVFFNGYTLHRSLPNRAKSGFRRALVNHYMSARSFLPWRYNESESMAMQDYRDIVMVAGVDPYASKGLENFSTPHVRPSGEGGCVDHRTQTPRVYRVESVAATLDA